MGLNKRKKNPLIKEFSHLSTFHVFPQGIAVIWIVRIWTVSGVNQTLSSVPPSTTPKVSSTTSKVLDEHH